VALEKLPPSRPCVVPDTFVCAAVGVVGGLTMPLFLRPRRCFDPPSTLYLRWVVRRVVLVRLRARPSSVAVRVERGGGGGGGNESSRSRSRSSSSGGGRAQQQRERPWGRDSNKSSSSTTTSTAAMPSTNKHQRRKCTFGLNPC